VDVPLRERVADAPSGKRHVVERRIVGHHADDDLAVAARIGHADRAPRAGLFEIGRFGGRPVEYEQVVSAAEQPFAHAPAHAAQTDQANLHRRLRCARRRDHLSSPPGPPII